MPVPILGIAQDWECPAKHCTRRARTLKPGAPAPSHQCPQMRGLVVPFVHKGTRAEMRAVERQDYIGAELVQTDGNGRPVMAVETVRDDGQDVAVYAPAATSVGIAQPPQRDRAASSRGFALNPTIRIVENGAR